MVTVHDSVFRGNHAFAAGGAIYVSGGDDRPCFPNLCASNLIVGGCEFEGNTLESHESEGQGSAIYIVDKVGIDLGWSVRDSTFTNNVPTGTAVQWHGVEGGSRAWSDDSATDAQLPHPKIKCDPDATPPEHCPGGVICPRCGAVVCECP